MAEFTFIKSCGIFSEARFAFVRSGRMREAFDVGIVGGGIMGVSTAYTLAEMGKKVVVLERASVGHKRSGSHGGSRMIGYGYEEADYVRLMIQAMQRWRRLAKVSAVPLFFETGGMDIAEDEEGFDSLRAISKSLRSARISYEELDHRGIKELFPAWHLNENARAVYSPNDTVINPSHALVLLVAEAIRRGAVIRQGEGVKEVYAGGSDIWITTEQGKYKIKRLVTTAGVWTNNILSFLGTSLPLEISQEQTVYFRPREDAHLFRPDRFSMFNHLLDPVVYGFPILYENGAIKVAFHGDGKMVDDVERIRRTRPSVIRRLLAYLNKYLPGARWEYLDADICDYDNTPDDHFFVGLLPGMPQIAVGVGFGGDGFKFGPAIGKALADLVLYGSTDICIDRFKIERFAQKSG